MKDSQGWFLRMSGSAGSGGRMTSVNAQRRQHHGWNCAAEGKRKGSDMGGTAPGCYCARLTSRATVSTWYVCGNMSTGWTYSTVYIAASIAQSRAWVVGLQLT